VTDTFYSQNNYSGSDIGFNSILWSSVQNQTEQLPFNGVYKMSYWSLLICSWLESLNAPQFFHHLAQRVLHFQNTASN